MPEELIPIIFFISIAAVLIFRPLTTRIGKMIEQSHNKKVEQDPHLQRIMQLMERLVDRMDRLEDRVDFAERMLERQRAQAMLREGPAREEPGPAPGESRAGEGDEYP
ncbi:MAG: hypothetical protein AMS25_11080 [Gemmatimonas sp. SM23_52]|nr:MAG: hypothetical protein AMS25_11080 [Gemmatimonas sp. SM23_52]